MAQVIPCYSVADQAAWSALRASLRAARGVRPARVHALSRTYYDTPDRRIYRAGRVLELCERRGERRLQLRERRDAQPLATEAVAAPPRYATDLPEGTLRDTLAAIAGPRVLLPVVRVRSRVTPMAVLDKQGEVGLELELDEARVRNGARGADQALGYWVRMAPGAAPRKLRERITALIADHAGIEDPTRDPYEAALLSSASPAPVELSRPKVALMPALLGSAAVARILEAYSRTLEANESGLLADLDIEFLHDYRVATRASRSVLNRMREVFPEREHEKARADLAWLGQITGPKRDLDVFLGDLDRHTARLPPLWRAHLEPLRAYLCEQQRVEHDRLAAELGSARYQAFKRDYPAWLARAAKRRVRQGPGASPAVALASRAIWRAYHALLSEGFSVLEDSPIERVHELRKTGKKLRYLIEAFQSLYRADAVRQIVPDLKHRPACLGAIVDRDVERQLLRRYGNALAARERPPPDETAVSMKMLEALLFEEQEAHRAGFDAALDRFARPRNRRLYRTLFGPLGDAGTGPGAPG